MVEPKHSTKRRLWRTFKWVVFFIGLFGIVFGVSYVFFLYTQQPSSSSTLSEKSLPPTRLLDADGIELDDQTLRRGKIILVFVSLDCKPCDNELEFLKSVHGRRQDVRFYAIVSFGVRDSLKDVARKYPFGIYLDGAGLAHSLGVGRVPIKIFVNEGQIEKTWGGATISQQAQAEFINWLENIR